MFCLVQVPTDGVVLPSYDSVVTYNPKANKVQPILPAQTDVSSTQAE